MYHVISYFEGLVLGMGATRQYVHEGIENCDKQFLLNPPPHFPLI